eukprot:COSAG01_NODE_7130_length_3337_cov_2.203212_1_plen_864_part_00
MAVDLLCHSLVPGHKVFDNIETVLTGFGAVVENNVMNSKQMSIHCLIETDIMLYSDLLKRMSEGLNYDQPPRNDTVLDYRNAIEVTTTRDTPTTTCIISEDHTAKLVAGYQKCVVDQLTWIDNKDYGRGIANQLPKPNSIDVGPEARVTQTDDGPEVDEPIWQMDRRGCACYFGSVDGTSHIRNDREELAFVGGGWEGAPTKGEYLAYMEMHVGSGPREETKILIEFFKDLRTELRNLGFGMELGGGVYLYDFPVWALDNTASNSGEGINTGTNGLLAMIDLVRRHEYNYLKRTGLRQMGRYVPTIGVSCQHHDSNLVAVHLSRLLRNLDLTTRDPFNRQSRPMAEDYIRGNKKTESFTLNAVRFIAGGLKQDRRWKSFLEAHFADFAGMPVVKSSRFWSVQIVAADYLYPRMKALWEFADSTADMDRLGHNDCKQMASTLAYAREHRELFEFDCLLLHVDYYGFQQPWNKNAADETRTPDEQAAYVKETVDLHTQCLSDAAARHAYWVEHSRPAVIKRALYEWKMDTTRARGGGKAGQPTSVEIAQEKARLEASVADVLPNSECVKRVKCMHEAVVTKLSELLSEQAQTGKVLHSVRESNAPVSNIGAGGVEDCFQFIRQMMDRHASTRMPILTAMRRVRTSDRQITLTKPPHWWPEATIKALPARARAVIRNWDHRIDVAVLKWQRTKDDNAVAAQRHATTADNTARLRDKAFSMKGGRVGEGEEQHILPTRTLLTLRMWRTVKLIKDGDKAGEPETSTDWTVDKLANQFKLRNQPEVIERRTPQLTAKLLEAGLITASRAALLSTGTKRQLAERLTKVLEVEDTATTEAAAVAAAAEAATALPARQRRAPRHSVAEGYSS